MEFNPLKLAYAVRQLCALLSVVLVLPSPMPGRTAAQNSQPLEVVAIQGDGAKHLVKFYKQELPIVEVRLAGNPVKGATVQFELPESGPSGYLESDSPSGKKSRTATTPTGRNGRATVSFLAPNKEPGAYKMLVTASYAGQTVETEMTQANVPSDQVRKDSNSTYRNTLILIAIGVGALVAVIAFVASGAAYN